MQCQSGMNNKIVEVLTDTFNISKQNIFKNIGSLCAVGFELPAKTVQWGYYYKAIKKDSPARFESIVMDSENKTDFVKHNNGICKSKRTPTIFNDLSKFCDYGGCSASNKIVSSNVLKGEHFSGLRNINYRTGTIILQQIVAFTE